MESSSGRPISNQQWCKANEDTVIPLPNNRDASLIIIITIMCRFSKHHYVVRQAWKLSFLT